jgi:tetratricopeptide (TPR) repeat protein
MDQLRNAVADAPENPRHHARLGAFYLYHGYLVEAMALFDRAIALGPDDVWLMTEFGGLLSKAENRAEALDFYLRALRVNPDYVPALVNTGGMLNALGRHGEALPYLEHALVLTPENPGIRYFLGVTFISLERHIEAREQLHQALSQLDDSAEASQLKQQIEAALEALSG